MFVEQQTTMNETQQVQPVRPMASPRKGRGRRRAAAAVAVSALTVLAGAAGSAVTIAVRGDGSGKVHSAPSVVVPSVQVDRAAEVAARAAPSVVTITVTTASGTGIGSGVVLTRDGAILTNDHVVADAAGGASSIVVTFSGGQRAAATVVGQDPAHDVAVIRAAATGLTPAVLGTSVVLHPGDWVVAIGSPLGLNDSVTVGVVSALHRDISDGTGGGLPGQVQQPGASLTDVIQTDASINPGNSGGALVDDTGAVVGICTAIATTGGGYIGQQSGSIGIGFAIPIATAFAAAQVLLTK